MALPGSPVPAGPNAIYSETSFRNWVTAQVATVPALAHRVPRNGSVIGAMAWDHFYDEEMIDLLNALDVFLWVPSLHIAGIRGRFQVAIVWLIRSGGRRSVGMAQSPLLF
jgi:hypothetical protein